MSNKKNRIIVCVLLASMLALLIAAYFIDPAQTLWAPKCIFHSLTGWQCPGCGISRAAHAVMHGHWLRALQYNYFFIISIPLLFAVAYTTFSDGRLAQRLRPVVQGRVVLLGYVVLFFVWWVLRNIFGI